MDERRALIARIARSPELRRQALELAGAVREAAFRPSSEAEVFAALQPMTLLYRMPDFKDDDPMVVAGLQRAWMKLHVAQLVEFPVEAIRAGVDAYIKVAKHGGFPTPGEIRSKIEPFASQMRVAAYRLKAAVELPAPRKPDPEERARVRALMADNGWLDANGNFDAKRALAKTPRAAAGPYRRPSETPQQMAARIRGGQ